MSEFPNAEKIKADEISAVHRQEIKKIIDDLAKVTKFLSYLLPFSSQLHQKGVTPLLVGFLANGDVAAKKYAEVMLLAARQPWADVERSGR
eukprot:228709-Hanusia_phi.AAC.2